MPPELWQAVVLLACLTLVLYLAAGGPLPRGVRDLLGAREAEERDEPDPWRELRG